MGRIMFKYRVVRAGVWKMVSAHYLKKYLTYLHQIRDTDAPGQNKDPFRTGWPLLHFQGHRGHLRQRHLRWFPLNISRNIQRILTKFVHQGKRRPSSNWLTLSQISRSQRAFNTTAYEIWFPLNVSRNIWFVLTKYGTQEHRGKTNNNFKLGIWKMASAHYLKKYLTYPHQI